MYPNNIKIEKISRLKIIKEKLKYFKDEMKSQIKYILQNRKHLTKIILVKLHI